MLPLQVQPESHVPLYVQLRDQLRALVHSGELRPGDRIPASRGLATQLGIHRTTVANAYAELESEGLIRGHVGRGTFICPTEGQPQFTPPPPPPSDGALRWEALFADERGEEALNRLMPEGPEGAISFAVARPPKEFFPVEQFRQCCSAVLRQEGQRILQLGASDGYGPLKRVLLDWLRAEGMAAREEQVLITDGCQQSLDLLCKAFLRPGDAVILENPAYPGAIAIFAASRIRCIGVPVRTSGLNGGGMGMDVGALEAALMQNRVKLIVTTPDFQNPTGTTLSVADRRRLLELAARFRVAVVEDHIYARLRSRGHQLPSLRSLDRGGLVIQIDSFSKIAFPGLRVGWCLAPAVVIERLRLIKQATDLHTGHLAQATLAEFVRRGYLACHLAKMRKLYARRLAALEGALEREMPEGVHWTRPGGGMSVWVTLPPGLDASELLIHVRERSVLFAPGRFFFSQSPQLNTLRLGFSALDERSIARGAAALGEVLRTEMRKRQRGARRQLAGRVALV